MGLRYEDLTTAQKEFSFYLLSMTEVGGVEDDVAWASTNFGMPDDPITVSPMSYTGSEFALFGKYVEQNFPSWYADWPQGWRTDIAAHPASDEVFWWYRYITYDENEQYKKSVNDHFNDAKAAIVGFYFDDSEQGLKFWCDYMCDACHVDTDDIKKFMYYYQMCVLSPSVCAATWGQVGDADLATIRDFAIAYMADTDPLWWRWGDGWTNRFAIYAWDPIVNWDGVSSPGHYGVDEGTYPTGGAETGNAVAQVTVGGYDKAYLSNGGQDLILVDSGGNKTLFRRAMANNVWVSTKSSGSATYGYNSNANPDGDPGTDPPVVVSGGWPYASRLLADLRAVEGQWLYDQDSHFSDPWVVEAGDCSSMVWWGVDRYDPSTAATMTFYDGSAGNTTIFQQVCSAVTQYGYNGDAIDSSIMQPGDLVLCNYSTSDSYMAGGKSGSHVAMWFAPGVMFHMFPSYGPTEITEADITDAVLYWEVRRMPYSD